MNAVRRGTGLARPFGKVNLKFSGVERLKKAIEDVCRGQDARPQYIHDVRLTTPPIPREPASLQRADIGMTY